MIIEPKVTAALSVQDERTVLLVSRSDNAGVINRLHWDLAKVEPEGHHALAQRIGSTVLMFLNNAHPEVFAKFPLLVQRVPGPNEDALDIVLALIRRSMWEKTLTYVDTIDRLLAQGDGDLARTDVAETWAELHRSLVEQLGGSEP